MLLLFVLLLLFFNVQECANRGDSQSNYRDVRQNSLINVDHGKIPRQHVSFRAEHNGEPPLGLDDG